MHKLMLATLFSIILPMVSISAVQAQLDCPNAAQVIDDSNGIQDSSQFEARLLELTNQERMRADLSPLRLSPSLSNAAQRHAEDMDSANYFSHTGRDGSEPWDRAQRAGYPSQSIGENIAAGNSTPEETMEQWMNSPGHRANILSSSHTEIGFGYSQNAGGQYRHYWVQVFGAG
jgi:uncharacterized protein YkwD